MSPVECGALYLSVNSIRTFEKFRFQRIRKALYNTTDDKIQMNWSLSTCKQYDILPDTVCQCSLLL